MSDPFTDTAEFDSGSTAIPDEGEIAIEQGMDDDIAPDDPDDDVPDLGRSAK